MQLMKAGRDGIFKIHIYINGRCISICGVSHRYNEKEDGILISNIRFARLVTAIVSSDTNRFIKYVDGDDIAMVLKPKTVNVIRAELNKIKTPEVIKGGDKLSVYKGMLKKAVEDKSKVQFVAYAACK